MTLHQIFGYILQNKKADPLCFDFPTTITWRMFADIQEPLVKHGF